MGNIDTTRTISDADLLEYVGKGGSGNYRGLDLTFEADYIGYTAKVGASIATGILEHGDSIGQHLLAVHEIRNLAAALAGDEPSKPTLTVDPAVAEQVAKVEMDKHKAQWADMRDAGLDVGDDEPRSWAEATEAERAIAVSAAIVALSEPPTGEPWNLPAPAAA